MKSLFPFYIAFVALALLFWAEPACALDEMFNQYKDTGLVIAQEADMAPMSFTGLNGQPKGYIIDLWRKWSAETGIPVTFLLTDWGETLTAVRDGRADVHGGLFYTEQRDDFLDFTLPFFQSKGGLFVKAGSSVRDVADLVGAQVGVVEQSFYDDYIRQQYPMMTPVPIRTSVELVTVADRGKVMAFLADYPTLMYQINSMGKMRDFKVVQFVSVQEFRAAVAEGNEAVLSVVAKGLELIDPQERQIIMNRWIISEETSTTDWILPTALLCGFGLLGAILVPFLLGRFKR